MAGFDSPVHLAFSTSRRWARIVLLAHVLVLGLAWLALPAADARLAASVLVCANLGAGVYRRRVPAARDAVAVLRTRDGRWRVTRRNGQVIGASLVGVPFVQAWLTVFRLRAEDGAVHAVVLLDDNAPAAPWRRLRVHLRLPRDDGTALGRDT
ncbi:MAG: protein YgfX [Gammaproteobacteria bacterium]